MKIALIISTLGCGGAERVVCRMAELWANEGRQVTILCVGRAKSFWEVDRRVTVMELDMLRDSEGLFDSALTNLTRVARLRSALAAIRPDAAISFMDTTNVLSLLASMGAPWRTIVCERSVPSRKPLALSWRLLRRLLYPLAHAVVVQSRDAASGLGGRLAIVPNFVRKLDPAGGGGKGAESLIVAMGRLSGEKQFDLLIRSMALVKARHPAARLSIWGEGESRGALRELAASLGLSDAVSLPGVTGDPEESLGRAQVYALTSRYEGFPNALCEAMAAGVPPVAFACPGGVADIVRHEVDGILVDQGNVEAMAEAISHLLADGDRRRRLAARAREISDRFSEARIMSLWEGLLRPVKHGG